MIVEWLAGLGLTFAGWFGTFFSAFPLPDWLTDQDSAFYGFLDSASGLGNWFPWVVLGSVVGFGGVVFLGTLTFRLLLKLWSLVPVLGGGG